MKSSTIDVKVTFPRIPYASCFRSVVKKNSRSAAYLHGANYEESDDVVIMMLWSASL